MFSVTETRLMFGIPQRGVDLGVIEPVACEAVDLVVDAVTHRVRGGVVDADTSSERGRFGSRVQGA